MKTFEIEAKMRVTDRAAMERLLEERGAAAVARLTETNTFFDTAEGRLKSTDQGLRVRVEQDLDNGRRAIITHKGPRAHGKLKSRSETEVVVDDPRKAAELLDALGFRPGLSFEKRRSRWKLEGCTIELDEVPYLGHFIEIEGPSDEAVLAVRDALGLADTPLIKSSYIAMLWTYLREHHISATHICFADAETAAAS
ncbi:MAG: class IV adenylate cyclase [Planctomycetes bacterium]|nr:class IV adenylate cyclase [Planctomycetota bacterium]